MRTTQGQAAFGYNIQAVITYMGSKKLKHEPLGVFRQCALHALTPKFTHPQNYFYDFNFFDILAKLSRNAKQHPSNYAHIMKRRVLSLWINVCYFIIPTDLQAQFPTCAARGAGVARTSTYPNIPYTTYRQRDASLTTKLDLAPLQSQS
jgi:hypothetical protein